MISTRVYRGGGRFDAPFPLARVAVLAPGHRSGVQERARFLRFGQVAFVSEARGTFR